MKSCKSECKLLDLSSNTSPEYKTHEMARFKLKPTQTKYLTWVLSSPFSSRDTYHFRKSTIRRSIRTRAMNIEKQSISKCKINIQEVEKCGSVTQFVHYRGCFMFNETNFECLYFLQYHRYFHYYLLD